MLCVGSLLTPFALVSLKLPIRMLLWEIQILLQYFLLLSVLSILLVFFSILDIADYLIDLFFSIVLFDILNIGFLEGFAW